MEKETWTVTGWSLPDIGMIHVILKNNNGKEESKTYSQMGSFRKWMHKHGLFIEACELEAQVEVTRRF